MDIINIIFNPPRRWGLRGDLYLWDKLKDYFIENGLLHSINDFEHKLYSLFHRFVGVQLGSENMSYVEEFAHGGMSSGSIDHQFWIDTGFPILIANYIRVVRD
ncbi:hypothetical protein [Listeria grandensis]|uniref:hypothetical protein n=1 Tax=Listeria grandensis TaxID=1494963 RepID=UPI00164E2CB7|nr:hypothetical protein [Listeria grandensis]MBC6316878.1 hypothetical protein [Listeria grandensis]